MIKLYGIPNCDTMKKVFDWLDERSMPYTFHNYKTQGIDKPKLESWLKQVPVTTLINLRSTTFKELPEKDRDSISQHSKAIALMMAHTSIIKRPVAEIPEGLILGFKKDEWERLLSKS